MFNVYHKKISNKLQSMFSIGDKLCMKPDNQNNLWLNTNGLTSKPSVYHP